MVTWQDRIVSDGSVHHGKVCIRGTRIPVTVVLDNLAAGLSPLEIIASYPSLNEADVWAAVSDICEPGGGGG